MLPARRPEFNGPRRPALRDLQGARLHRTFAPSRCRPKSARTHPLLRTLLLAIPGGLVLTFAPQLEAQTVTTTISAGIRPCGVAVNPVTNKIYVPNASSANVTVIDGATNVTTTVSVGTGPCAVAVNPVTNKVYVANGLGNNVTVIDGATNATTTVLAGTNPEAVAVNPVTNKIYVANGLSNNVTVIDGATNATITVSAGA